ncbi:MAG: glycosyltransferase family 2 protein [Betaproteobacteria bacterium]|nr:glycosyltransferase family 2 protein [Betaproteobacteria bacterium]MBL8532577.1 glycosyltransferase family 2 protein [Betaproteobacteria bacterium]
MRQNQSGFRRIAPGCGDFIGPLGTPAMEAGSGPNFSLAQGLTFAADVAPFMLPGSDRNRLQLMSASSSHARVGVVIPFFQRQPGLLRRALDSVNRQSILANEGFRILVCVVDDESPVSARDELIAFEAPANVELIVHRQSNQGAGGARNTCLELLEGRVDILAFLDSDDTWSPDHLLRAVTAIDAGIDFYFCNALREGSTQPENRALPSWFESNLQPLDGMTDVFAYRGPWDLPVVHGMIPTTSTIVHRQRGDRIRFPRRYFRFGEDQYYCLSHLRSGSQLGYSSRTEILCGRGVNIFAGNAPLSEGQRLCWLDEISYRQHALQTLPLSDGARRHLEQKLVDAQKAVVKQGIWLAASGKPGWLMKSLLHAPGLLFRTPSAASEVLKERASANHPSQPT